MAKLSKQFVQSLLGILKSAEEAKQLATCDGPPYYYKVAYDEAVKMLESLKV